MYQTKNKVFLQHKTPQILKKYTIQILGGDSFFSSLVCLYYVNSKKPAFIKSCGNILLTELTPKPIWSTILDVF